jgi:hypothetical protein
MVADDVSRSERDKYGSKQIKGVIAVEGAIVTVSGVKGSW